MKNNNKHIFDRQLNERLSSEELSFDPVAWEKMEKKLDKQPRGFFFWRSRLPYFLVLTGILVIATICYWPHHYNNIDNNQISETKNTSISEEAISSNDQNKISDAVVIDKSIQTKEASSVLESARDHDRSMETKKKNVTLDQGTETVNNDNLITEKKALSSSASSSLRPVSNDSPSSSFLTKESSASATNAEVFKVTGLSSTEVSSSTVIKESAFPIDGLELLEKETALLSMDPSIIDLDLQTIEIEEEIIRPRHQFNISVGGGMTDTELGEDSELSPPVSVTNHEAFLSLSYLSRIRKNWGIEAGVRGSYQTKKVAKYLQAGEFNLSEPAYGKVNATNLEGKYELFTNVHFYLPLDKRSELDFHIGYFSMNPFETQGTSGSGGRYRSPENENVNILATEMRRETGPFKAGRLNLGVNYNFLTNKRNTVGIGISYMHQLHGNVTGDYYMFQSSDFTGASGKFKENGSGFKVQINYGFGLGDDLSQGLFKKKMLTDRRPWYLGARFGLKKYSFNDELSKDLISANSNRSYSFFLGHYIASRTAFEVGLEYYQFVFSTPSELVIAPSNFGVRRQGVLSVPLALRRDLLQAGRLLFYGKGALSMDFRLDHTQPFSKNHRGGVTDESKLRLNAGLEAGVDIQLYKGINIGLQAKYNRAFSRLALYQYPVTYRDNEYEFQDINLKNNYFSWGVELKYVFGQ